MDEEIIFKSTAFKHDVVEADIRSAFDQALFDGTMREMTDAEAEYLDDLWTRTTPEIDVTKPGYFARKGLVLGEVAPDVAEYLRSQAAVTYRTQADIVNNLVREKIAATA